MAVPPLGCYDDNFGCNLIRRENMTISLFPSSRTSAFTSKRHDFFILACALIFVQKNYTPYIKGHREYMKRCLVSYAFWVVSYCIYKS